MASMRDWLKDPQDGKERVVVVHCKAGKGRSGTSACSYLISEEGWSVEDALTRFTARRMRSGFGSGVSIPSQVRWIRYVDWWTQHGKVYVERQIEVLEVHVWGLRDGVKVAVEGFVDKGRTIKTFHTFGRHERMVMDNASADTAKSTTYQDHINEKPLPLHESNPQSESRNTSNSSSTSDKVAFEPGANAVLFRPTEPLILPTSDINIDFERRNKAAYGFTMVTSVAHVWFNAFFEPQHSSTSPPSSITSPSSSTNPLSSKSLPDSGVFEISWEAMDGIKGSARKGTRALDRLAVVWRAIDDSENGITKIIAQPPKGEPVPESGAADWKGANQESAPTLGKDLGLRAETPNSAHVSKANSMVDIEAAASKVKSNDSGASVRSHGPEGEEHILHPDHPTISISEPSPIDHSRLNPGQNGPEVDLGMQKVHSPAHSPGITRDLEFDKAAGIENGLKAVSIDGLPTPKRHIPGQFLKDDDDP